MMVMNDMWVNIPDRIPRDRYFLSLFCAPVCEPDLLLPGPVVQPQGGTAFYPNGFVDEDRLCIAYTHSGIHSSVIHPLPDFSRPFLMPRGGRPGLKIENDIAYFGQRQSSLGLVLTHELTRKPRLRLAFDVRVNRYSGAPFPILTLGGKTRNGTVIRAAYSEKQNSDFFQVSDTGLAKTGADAFRSVAPFKMKEWNHFEIELTTAGWSISINGSQAQTSEMPLLRKICFGGLYEKPEWPMGVSRPRDIHLRLDTIVVE